LDTKKTIFKNRILLGMLVPVFGVGVLFTVILTHFLTPPLVNLLKSRTDASLKHASDMGIRICEERFTDLLDLRLENDEEMNAAFRKEAMEQIKAISQNFPGIHMLILNKDRKILAASLDIPSEPLKIPKLKKIKTGVVPLNFWGEPIRVHYQYFPFWRWHIATFIFDNEYNAPILMAKRIVNIGTIGILMVVLLAVLFLFLWKVNRPLKQIISATEEVSQGKLYPIDVRRKDEIAQVALAFNAMVQSLAQDKKQIKSIMAELRNSEERYRAITEFSLANIAIVQHSRYIYANKMMFKTLGYDHGDFIGKKFWQRVHPEDSAWVEKKISAIEIGDSHMDHFECRYQTMKGETLWFEILATAILFQEQHAVLLHAIDITARKTERLERRKLERKLARAQKMEAIGTLAGGVAHDLNNILSGIVSYPELLLLDLPQDSPLVQPILTIKESGERAAAIVQDLLTLARRGVAITEVININHTIYDYMNSPEYEKLKSFHPDISIATHLEDDLLNIKGSSIHLTKTIMNLVTNAAEAMLNGGKITISTKNQYIEKPVRGYDEVKEGDYIILSITDNGTGISPDDMDRIFEPFYTKKTMGRSGTGLGMAVVWGTVKDHNGYIDVQSTEGKGSTFTLYFPVTRKEIAKDESEVSIDEYKKGNGEYILVVDDVEDQRRIASGMLSKLGYGVQSVSSGIEAVEYLQKNSADLLLLDMIMEPGINGRETYERIIKFVPNQKAIIASGYSETDEVKKAQALGAGKYIKKPYTLEKIGIAVRDELKK
jgi:PAS domain S-box-containing protein